MRALILPAVFAILTTSAGLARAAGDDDPRKAQAEAVFKEGVKLHGQGKNEEALAKLNEAYGIYPSPNTLGGIARVEQAMGRRLEAMRHYREALKNPLMHPENAGHAKKAVAELEGTLGRVDIVGPKGLVVTIDGREHILPLTDPIDVAADAIKVLGTLGNVRYEGAGTAALGKVTSIEMRPVDRASSTNAGAAPGGSGDHVTLPPREPDPSFWTTGHTIGVIGWGAVVVAGAFGIVFTGNANRASDEIEEARAKSDNPDSSCAGVTSVACDERRAADRDLARNTNLAIGSFVGAGVLLVGATAAFFLWPSSTTRSARLPLVPSVSQTGGGLLFQQEF